MNPTELLVFYLPSFPMYIAWLVGGVLALVRWHRHPKVSAVMAVATVLFVFQSLAGLATFWLIRNQASFGWGAGQLVYALGAMNIARSVVAALAYALLLVAVYGWRKAMVPEGALYEPPPEDEPPDRED
jgi:hypothetical protein